MLFHLKNIGCLKSLFDICHACIFMFILLVVGSIVALINFDGNCSEFGERASKDIFIDLIVFS